MIRTCIVPAPSGVVGQTVKPSIRVGNPVHRGSFDRRPDPSEHPVTFIHTETRTRGFTDLCRAGRFVIEAKEGVTGTSADDDRPAALPADPPGATRRGHGTRGTRGLG
jgi:hypothetical protein